MMVPRFLLLLFLIVALVFAADKPQNEDDCSNGDKGDLEVKQDKSLLYKPGYQQYLWSSIVTLDKEPEDPELVAIAHKASEEMRDTLHSAPKNKQPSVMTALQVGKVVYLASSATGDYSLIYNERQNSKNNYPGNGELRSSVPDEMKEALRDAQKGNNQDTSRQNIQHANDGACGEVMASYTYLLSNQMKGLKGKKNPRPKSIAWNHPAGKTEGEIYNPCGTDSNTQWGCDAFCSKMGFSIVNTETTEATSYPKVVDKAQKTIMTKELKEELNTKIDADKKKQKEKQDQQKKEREERNKQKQAEGKKGNEKRWKA